MQLATKEFLLAVSILLVDDEPQTRDLLRLMLKRDGYEVIDAEDGHDALRKVREHIPTVVLLDVMMPAMDGLEVCETMKADETVKHIPVIMFSARTHQEAVEAGIAAGAVRYLTKPISRADLLRNVKEVLDGVPSPETLTIRRNLVSRNIIQE